MFEMFEIHDMCQVKLELNSSYTKEVIRHFIEESLVILISVLRAQI